MSTKGRRVRLLAVRAFLRQLGLCFWCRRPMVYEQRAGHSGAVHPRLLTAEHVVEASRGGRGDPDNIVAACWQCNHERQRRDRDLPPRVWSSDPGTPMSPFEALKGLRLTATELSSA